MCRQLGCRLIGPNCTFPPPSGTTARLVLCTRPCPKIVSPAMEFDRACPAYQADCGWDSSGVTAPSRSEDGADCSDEPRLVRRGVVHDWNDCPFVKRGAWVRDATSDHLS